MPCRITSENTEMKTCPCLSHSVDEMISYYDETDMKLAYEAALVEYEGYAVETRVEEIMDYAHKMGFSHLGLAFCVGFAKEARTFVKILRANGFRVDAVSCKNCGVPKDLLGITHDQYVNRERDVEAMCNPVGQAKLLNAEHCDFAVMLGLCVGHDTLFLKHIEPPVTVLAVKDRAMGNNPLGAIYTADGYMKRQYSFMERKYGAGKK